MKKGMKKEKKTLNCQSFAEKQEICINTSSVTQSNVDCVAPLPCRPKLRRPNIEVVSPQHRNCVAPSK